MTILTLQIILPDLQQTHKAVFLVSFFFCLLYQWSQPGTGFLETSAVHTQGAGMPVHCASDNDLPRASAKNDC